MTTTYKTLAAEYAALTAAFDAAWEQARTAPEVAAMSTYDQRIVWEALPECKALWAFRAANRGFLLLHKASPFYLRGASLHQLRRIVQQLSIPQLDNGYLYDGVTPAERRQAYVLAAEELAVREAQEQARVMREEQAAVDTTTPEAQALRLALSGWSATMLQSLYYSANPLERVISAELIATTTVALPKFGPSDLDW